MDFEQYNNFDDYYNMIDLLNNELDLLENYIECNKSIVETHNQTYYNNHQKNSILKECKKCKITFNVIQKHHNYCSLVCYTNRLSCKK